MHIPLSYLNINLIFALKSLCELLNKFLPLNAIAIFFSSLEEVNLVKELGVKMR